MRRAAQERLKALKKNHGGKEVGNVTAEKVVRLLPALVFTDKDAQELVSILSALIREFLA